MSRGLRILHIADTHIGAQLTASPRRPAAASRGDDFIRSYMKAVERADEFEVDLVVHAGDVFDEPAPSDAAMAAAGMPLLRLAGRGVPVVIIPGNHERCVLPGSLFFSHENLHVLDRPGVRHFDLRGVRVAIAGLPCIRRGAAARFEDALAESGHTPGAADINILVAHQAFESAVCGPATFRFRTGDDVVDRDQIPAGFHYVAAGHVHRHQVLEAPLGAGGPIVYAGSTDRITFAEQREPKGCVLIEVEGDALHRRFIEHDVRTMASLPLDVTGRTRDAIRDSVLSWAGGLPCGALAQARLSGRTEPRHMRGLALREIVRACRPDLLFSSTAQSVQFVPGRELVHPSGERPAEPAAHAASPAAMFAAPIGTSPEAASRGSVFDSLALDARRDSAAWRRIRVSADACGELPKRPGTYALFDADGRLLYVGKALDVRTRVRTHLRRPDAGAFFAGWTQRIAQIEVRPAGCELEALLVEAELIRRHRPPFNREMRNWSRYCYLVEQADVLAQLAVCAEADEQQPCFGPYRSRFMATEMIDGVCGAIGLPSCPDEANPPRRGYREVRETGAGMFALTVSNTSPQMRSADRRAARASFDPSAALRTGAQVRTVCDRYYAGQCAGSCGGHVVPHDHRAALRLRRQLLQGHEAAEPLVCATERAAELWSQRCEVGPATADSSHGVHLATVRARMLARRAAVLRTAWEHGRMLDEASALVGRPFEIGKGPSAITILLDQRGLHLGPAPKGEADGTGSPACIQRELLDGLLTVVRGRRRENTPAAPDSDNVGVATESLPD